jgi:prepilin-type N-terminal cleavage/methylation domain-containing protein
MKMTGTKKGLTLVEVVISVAVFSIIMAVTASLFGSNIDTKRRTDRARVAYERMQVAMNVVAKTLRTSSIVSNASANSPSVRVYDYSQEKCVEFSTSSNVLTISETSVPIADKDTQCTPSSSLGSTTNLSNSFVIGRFRTVKTDEASDVRGSVTMSFTVCPTDFDCTSESSELANMQTTVSLRDYQ